MLVVVSGLPGVGKTAVSVALARRLGAVHLSVDPVEDALLGAGLDAGLTVGVAAYEAVRAAAESNLKIGRTVVVDAVNDSGAARDTWAVAARSVDTEIRFVYLVCSDAGEQRSRLAQRERCFGNLREPTWADVEGRAAVYEPWVGAHLRLDTAGVPIDATVASIDSYLDD